MNKQDKLEKRKEELAKLQEELESVESEYNIKSSLLYAEIKDLQNEIDEWESKKYKKYVGKFLRIVVLQKDRYIENQKKEIGNVYIHCNRCKLDEGKYLLLYGYQFTDIQMTYPSFISSEKETSFKLEDIRIIPINKELFLDAYNEYIEKEIKKINNLAEYDI